METEVTGRKGKILIFVIALFGALILWMYAIGYDTEIDERVFSGIQVEITGLNVNGYTVADGENFSLNVDARASGTRSVLNNSDVSDFRAYVDISSVGGPGYATLPVTVVAPTGLTVESLSVSNVTLYVDTFTSKTINIQIEKTYSSEYEIGEVVQSLYAVSVYGPESIVGTAEAYSSFELGTITGNDIHVSGEIHLRDSATKAMISNPYITMSSSTVDVTFIMYGSKTVPVELALEGGTYSAEDVQFLSSVSGVKLRGPMSELAQVSALAIVCDETEIEDGKLVSTITAGELLANRFPESSLSAEEPEAEITYTVILPEIRSKTVSVPISRMTVYGLPDSGKVHAVANASLEVTVFGSAAAVKAYDGEQMTVRINYQTLVLQAATGEYLGEAEISTGSSAVCVDGSVYTVPVRVIITE